MSESGHRPVWAEIDLGALRANVRSLAAIAAPAEVLAVVKADAYGHGAVEVARAALEAGATRLGVALIEEGQWLRFAGIDAPILVMSEPPTSSAPALIGAALTPVVYSFAGVEAIAKAVIEVDAPRPYGVHLKVDTGMGRVGATAEVALEIARFVEQLDELALVGVCTHFATADEPGNPLTDVQIERFQKLLDALGAEGIRPPLVHAANTAATLRYPEARYSMVRTGIGMYGVAPAPALADLMSYAPVMSIKACVSFVKDCPAGTRLSYGQRYELPRAARIATVPVGYADGVPRGLGETGGEVLIGGRRFPIAGTITMDQLMVDCGDAPVAVGDEVVLIGRQGDEAITADEWAERLGTIAYEIVCGIGPRVPRRVRG